MKRILCSCLALGCLLALQAQPAGAGQVQEPRQEPAGIDAVFSPPSPETIPDGLPGERIRLGYKIVVNTQEYARRYVGNKLNCTNCHLDAGLNPNAASFVGLSVVYPEYRARADRIMSLADRINECFERSLNGTPLPANSSRLNAVVAYIDWLSQNVPRGSKMAWRGIPRINPSRQPGPEKGKEVFANKCAFCHGSGGQGTITAPPVWGPKSYNIAAGMARVSVAASFIKANMPRGWGWTLTDDEAFDVAAYINSRPRPDFPGKVRDWPKGGKPTDSPY
jgi:thiosulfate dehydrogenase